MALALEHPVAGLGLARAGLGLGAFRVQRHGLALGVGGSTADVVELGGGGAGPGQRALGVEQRPFAGCGGVVLGPLGGGQLGRGRAQRAGGLPLGLGGLVVGRGGGGGSLRGLGRLTLEPVTGLQGALELGAGLEQRGLSGLAAAEDDAAAGVEAEPVAGDREAALDRVEGRGVLDQEHPCEQARRGLGRQRDQVAERRGAGRDGRNRALGHGLLHEHAGSVDARAVEQLERGGQVVGHGGGGAPAQRRGRGQLEARLRADEGERQRGAGLGQAADGGSDAVGPAQRGLEGLDAGARRGGLLAGHRPGGAGRVETSARALGGGVGRGCGVVGAGLERPSFRRRRRGFAELGGGLLGVLLQRRSGGLGLDCGSLELCGPARQPSVLGSGPGGAALGTRGGAAGPECGLERHLGLGRERSELLLVVGPQPGGLGLQALGPLGGVVALGPAGRSVGGQALGTLARPGGLPARLGELGKHPVAPRLQPFQGGAQGPEPGRGLLLGRAQRGQLLLGALAPAAGGGQHGLEPVALGPGSRQLGGQGAAPGACRGGLGGQEQQAPLGELAADLLGSLGGRRLQAQRGEPRADLLLDVRRPLEVEPHPGELLLGAAPAALELAEPGGLLDQAPALVGPGQEDLVDAALGDDAVQLASEPRVGQGLLHVEPSHLASGQEVLGVAFAAEPAHHRHLGLRQGDPAVLVREHQLDLAQARGAAPVRAGEQHVLPGLGAQLARRLRGHDPLDRVGDVRLPRPVRADDHGHAGEEAQLDGLGERLEAADAERLEVHQPAGPSASRASASRAADCSAVFFELPRPLPRTTPSTTAVVVK